MALFQHDATPVVSLVDRSSQRWHLANSVAKPDVDDEVHSRQTGLSKADE